MIHSVGPRDRTNGSRSKAHVEGFAAATEPVALLEERRELLREAQWSLGEWERHRREEDRGRLLAVLEALARLIRAERPS